MKIIIDDSAKKQDERNTPKTAPSNNWDHRAVIQEKIGKILENLPGMVFAFDLDGNIQYTNSNDKRLASFWEITTPNTQAVIETAITNAMAQEPAADGTWPLFGGRSMALHLVFKNGQELEELQLISIKGTIYLIDSSPECVVTLMWPILSNSAVVA